MVIKMEFNLTEDQRLIGEMVSDFAEKELQDRAVEIDENSEFPTVEVQKMAKLGLLGLAIPEKYKGNEVDLVSMVIAVEEMSKYCASTSLIFMVHNMLVSAGISQFSRINSEVGEVRTPILTRFSPAEKPGVPFSRIKAEIPPCFKSLRVLA